MPPSRTRYVTACQQLLALGVVVAALTPAASVVSLDVVRQTPGSAPPAPTGRLAAHDRVPGPAAPGRAPGRHPNTARTWAGWTLPALDVPGGPTRSRAYEPAG